MNAVTVAEAAITALGHVAQKLHHPPDGQLTFTAPCPCGYSAEWRTRQVEVIPPEGGAPRGQTVIEVGCTNSRCREVA